MFDSEDWATLFEEEEVEEGTEEDSEEEASAEGGGMLEWTRRKESRDLLLGDG